MSAPSETLCTCGHERFMHRFNAGPCVACECRIFATTEEKP